jgi:DNA (cytosine-5)-methyltransferase 1
MEAGREVWSFFTGAMGLDLGVEQAGIQTSLAVELNPTFCDTIRRNRPSLCLLERDVCGLTGSALRHARGWDGDVYLVTGGPPCQSFSSGGKRAALTDPRGNLLYEYLRLVGEIRPRYFILENVANIVTAALRHRAISQRPGRHWSLKRYGDPAVNGAGDAPPLDLDEMASSAIRRILSDIEALRYDTVFGVLNAADFGAPQRRLRFLMIGCRDGRSPDLPAPTHGPLGSGLAPYVTVRDVIADLEDTPGPHSEYTDRVREFFALVPAGGTWRSLPAALHREALGDSFDAGGGKTGFYRRLGWDEPAPTITGRANRKGSALCHPTQVRPLSVRECARLQGFPDAWQFSGSMNSQYQQIGNAVPVALGTAVGLAIRQHSEGDSRSDGTTWSPRDQEGMLMAAIRTLRAAGRNRSAQQREAMQLALAL